MKDGWIRVCAATPSILVADPVHNREQIFECIKEAYENRAKVVVLPELCLTGYTCGDLFLQKKLIDSAEEQLILLAHDTVDMDILICIGLPVVQDQMLYNCCAFLYRGRVLGLVPKKNLPNYGEFYEQRYFVSGKNAVRMISFAGQEVPFGVNLLVQDEGLQEFTLGVEICEDVWTVAPPSNQLALAGATVIANLSASNELISKEEYRSSLILTQSARLYCGYIYADAGEGESTTDLVFAGDNILAENGTLVARSRRFKNENIYGEFDLQKLVAERSRVTIFESCGRDGYTVVYTCFDRDNTEITRKIAKTPFVPADSKKREKRSEEILSIQSMGLKKRLLHSHAKTAVIGVSGGLDSTLALLVTVRAFDRMGRDRADIWAVTMPCFGTTSRTYQNACAFARSLGVTLKEIPIRDAVLQHFRDIEQDPQTYDVTYENAQARERTQILMDLANKSGGMVIGTGDLSELALGWATYNGDHMSMYAVNAGVPKTLIRYLVDYEAKRTDSEILRLTLEDILDTPVSPELLPPKDGQIAQKTEHIVGPYELHDFFLYYLMRFGFAPGKILRMACYAFAGQYEKDFILAWMKVFYRRFFSQQFKRSCVPDGPKVGSVSLSPRGDWRMPSDASVRIWMDEIENL